MESLEIARLLREAFPQEVLDIREHRGQVALLLRHERILDVLVYARQHFGLMHLRSLCGVDNSRRKQHRRSFVSPSTHSFPLHSIERAILP